MLGTQWRSLGTIWYSEGKRRPKGFLAPANLESLGRRAVSTSETERVMVPWDVRQGPSSYVPSTLFGLLALILIKAVKKPEVRRDYVTRCFSDSDMKGTLWKGEVILGEVNSERGGWNPRICPASFHG